MEEINGPVSLKPCVHVKLIKSSVMYHLNWKELLNITLRLRTTKTDINQAQLVVLGGVRAMVCTMRAVRVTFVMLPKNREIAAKLVKVMAPAVPCPNFAWKAS